MTLATNPSLSREALYAKSQVYIQRALRAQIAKELEEYQLWASLALELLGKAALAKLHPCLIADPTHYQSLFAACGRQLSPDVKTITAKTLFERLTHLEKAFDSRHQKFCEQLAIRRNAELHSGESPFSGMTAEAWEREFWGAIETVLHMQGETLESWLGAEDAKTPASIIERANEAMVWAVAHRIKRCREDFEKKHPDPKKRSEVIASSDAFIWNDYSWDAKSRSKCPSCSCVGFVGGSLWDEKITENESAWHDEDQYWDPLTETVEKFYSSEEFVCLGCGFRVFGTKEVAAAGFAEEFVVTVERERDFGDDYGND